MDLRVDPSLPTPPSRQLVEAVLDRIAAGALTPGDRLPSVRGLAAEALVNPNTVSKAYRDLEALGVVEGRSGAGVFVRAEGPALARGERRHATLDLLKTAIETAVGAGHEPATLAGYVREWLSNNVPSQAQISEVSGMPRPARGRAAKLLKSEPGSVGA